MSCHLKKSGGFKSKSFYFEPQTNSCKKIEEEEGNAATTKKVPYGFPSGRGLTYVRLKKTYFYFPLSALKREMQEIGSKKGWRLSFIHPIKLTRVSEDWRPFVHHPDADVPMRLIMIHLVSHTLHRGSPAVLAAAPQSTGQGSNCNRDSRGVWGGCKDWGVELHQSGCFIHTLPSSPFTDLLHFLQMSISFEAFVRKKTI